MSTTTIPSSLLSPSLSSFKLSFPSTKLQPLSPQFRCNRIGFSFSSPTFSPWKRFAVNDNNKESDNGDVLTGLDEVEKEARGNSTMPERFRYLAKEVPSLPVRWPWLVVLAFMVYAWRAVLFELSNWKNGAFAIVRFLGYLLKYAFAVVYQFIGSPITFSIRCIEDLFYTVRASYSWIIHNSPVPDLTIIIMLASIVLAIGEATVPNSINDQHNVLTVSGLIGYAAVRGYISELFFWTILLGVYAFSKFVKKRDDVSAAMPVAAVLAGVGEPWVRALVIISYTALAIYQYSKTSTGGKEVGEVETRQMRLPIPLLLASFAIGLRVAAKWVGYRHLTWMSR